MSVPPPNAGRGSEAFLPEGEEKTAYVRKMFDRIAPRYDLVNRMITFGLDRGWRSRTARALDLAPGAVVLDLASGTGDLLRELATLGHRAVGADLSFGMLSATRGSAAPLIEADGAALPIRGGSLDGIVCGFAVRNFTDLSSVLAECSRVLRPAGRIAILEVDTPDSPFLRFGHELWFTKVVPWIGGIVSDHAAYRYLPRSIAYLPNARAFGRLLEQAGFTGVTRHQLAGGVAQLVTATRIGVFGVASGLS
jgi:demethylmenaquinone methyltransferase/2-methoxy-6-polyprenyl-1,4-benzoquinol methylase